MQRYLKTLIILGGGWPGAVIFIGLTLSYLPRLLLGGLNALVKTVKLGWKTKSLILLLIPPLQIAVIGLILTISFGICLLGWLVIATIGIETFFLKLPKELDKLLQDLAKKLWEYKDALKPGEKPFEINFFQVGKGLLGGLFLSVWLSLSNGIYGTYWMFRYGWEIGHEFRAQKRNIFLGVVQLVTLLLIPILGILLGFTQGLVEGCQEGYNHRLANLIQAGKQKSKDFYDSLAKQSEQFVNFNLRAIDLLQKLWARLFRWV